MNSTTLNPEQRRAVEHGEGPLLVIAGPGSGKTRVITERIVCLLENVKGLQPENILALTFTDKAAELMKRRVRDALPNLVTSPHISTFHSFCYQVLRQRHFDRRLLDKIDVWVFLRRRMEMLGLEFYQKLAEPGAFLHDLNGFFSRCQDELVAPDDFERYVRKVEDDSHRRTTLDPAERNELAQEVEKLNELARVFRMSRRLIEDAGYSSFGSLISETIRLWEREPEVLERHRARFRYVLVDEFQDTNYAQVELLRRLVAPPLNVTAVGDDDQAIYRFRGASHGAFGMFRATFPGHATVYLNRNYRSTRKILQTSEAVIARNKDRYPDKPPLHPTKDEGSAVYLLESPDYSAEAAWIAGEVERLVHHGTPSGDTAVLYRSHHYRDPLVDEFRRRKIPFVVRGLSVHLTVIVRDLVAYLKLVHSPHENISLTRALVAPRWRFPESLALDIRKQGARHRCSLYDALEMMERSLLKADLEATGWLELKQVLAEGRKSAKRLPVTELFDLLVARLGLTFLPGDRDAVYVEAFGKFLEGWEGKSETRRLEEFMEYFDYFLEAGGRIEAPEPPDPANAVQMMSVHAAKGLEFSVAFILSVARQRFPHREQKPVIEFPEALRRGPAPPSDIHLQEERRLFYVAMTRARERLYISSVAPPGKKPSPFVDDLLRDPVVEGRDVERIQVSAAAAREAPAAPSPSEPRARETGQASLFSETTPPASAVHPNLAAWASQPVENSSDGKLRLSASAIETYQDCPLKFKMSHYLKVPTGPQPTLTFGSLMHRAVRHYFELRRKGLPRFEDLEAFYLAQWKDVGFEDAYQEQAYKKAGLEQLRAFVARHNATSIPAGPMKMEQHFELDLGGVTLEGRIDQIRPLDLLGPRGQTEVELVDYKTGRPRTERDAHQSLQLSVYALAARDQLKLNPARLTFYNLTNNQPVSSVRTAQDLDKARGEILAVAEQIRSQRFQPTPGFVCRWCDFLPLCPAHEENY